MNSRFITKPVHFHKFSRPCLFSAPNETSTYNISDKSAWKLNRFIVLLVHQNSSRRISNKIDRFHFRNSSKFVRNLVWNCIGECKKPIWSKKLVTINRFQDKLVSFNNHIYTFIKAVICQFEKKNINVVE